MKIINDKNSITYLHEKRKLSIFVFNILILFYSLKRLVRMQKVQKYYKKFTKNKLNNMAKKLIMIV